MAKQDGRTNKRNRAVDAQIQRFESAGEYSFNRHPEPIKAKTTSQERYINAIKNFNVVFSTGPAGTGKTWIATALAAEQLFNKRIDKIIITRPAVEAGEHLGFLPGELGEKFDPYLRPFKEILEQRLGRGFVEYAIKREIIEAAPLGYMRGRTFNNTWVILDEAQNTTPSQMLLFLTRFGNDCKMIVNGDITQKDIKGPSGLEDAIERISYLPSVKHVKFDTHDIVRHGLVQEIVEAYRK